MNRSRAATILLPSFAVYLVVGLTLSLKFGYLLGDALSRTYAAQAVLFSRDPHVSAIGFVFTPLTALLQLPLVAFSNLLPALTRWNISGLIVSAVFMAGTVVVIHGICRDRGCTRTQTYVLTALFAINPMIVFYGANGMSEAVFLFFVCAATRRLLRWVHTDDVHDLLVAGVALAFAYLTRYDAVAAVAGTAALVFLVTLLRRGGRGRAEMTRRAILDAVLVASPGLVAFLVWAATSWLITGEALAQLSSSYGNAAILEQSGGSTGGPSENALFSIMAIVVLAPVLPVVLPIAAALSLRRRDLEFLVAPVVLGSVLAFQLLSFATGSTFGFLRFYICAIPLVTVAAIQWVPARGHLTSRRPGVFARRRPELGSAIRPVAVTVMALSAVALPVTAFAMVQPSLSSQQYALGSLFDVEPTSTEGMSARRVIASFSTERTLAEYLDRQDLAPGSILTDSVYGFAIVAASEHPDRFVVPSDDGFTEVLNEPAAAGVRYILTVPNVGRGESDAVNRRYPTIWDNGGGVATLALEVPNDGADQPVWRVYEVLG
ncbi:hypothetical protein GCM10007304_47870 [Rhodococcoides trifolii]|uniref:Glycosyltransferase RgtA/B/C/D-like domain-containing protein n=1 Tax=Rhodococcoides trifolii TaxID=908250 RepID=A0A917LIW8_9NOCA|nr:glycosyltransferase family 39 protein [Rhodococcus trifolii]GGG28423.1 hypothetical protein GCM10007304_47870 [Rhodococcus trifolii]